ncbi:dUTP diphosphatase [Proteiniclasticum sp. QWL-01]|uniref:dUTP diphosphatase n=1 Tax=Proteiniclasticum sp. QWL-01 TaxID=3036945 RepID=UPI002204F570|nr:dUTP diphosphatase [Proteiniclasticum sp. QWL-01]UUM11504.1 dUTP diphosphatase [Clostridiaceae bacterium HFYG-1003]WFF72955.1 dUTP diphosphatase [Proteiniclasticum sp. QWL-01]
MQLRELFAVQKQLNERIVQEHGLDPASLKNKKYLALLTELGELANETRCFKYWSTKPPSHRDKILEEYVDCLHFILTIGLDHGFEEVEPDDSVETTDLTSHFIDLFLAVNELVSFSSMNSFEVLLEDFFALGRTLGFTLEDIREAYLAKNQINHQRQDNHY